MDRLILQLPAGAAIEHAKEKGDFRWRFYLLEKTVLAQLCRRHWILGEISSARRAEPFCPPNRNQIPAARSAG